MTEDDLKTVKEQIVELKIQQAATNFKLDDLTKKLESFNNAINRGLWILGGGFLAAVVTWITGGGLQR
jgi:hypothetical protein